MMFKKVLSAAETNRTLLSQRGQSDQGHYRSRAVVRDKGEKSHVEQTAAESRPRCDYDVQEGVQCGGNESDLALREGQFDQGHYRSRAVVQATAPALVNENVAPAPAVSHAAPAPVPVSEHVAPAPAVTQGSRAPVIEPMAPDIAGTDSACSCESTRDSSTRCHLWKPSPSDRAYGGRTCRPSPTRRPLL